MDRVGFGISILAAVMLFSVAAAAQDEPIAKPDGHAINRPTWIQIPDPDLLQRYFPYRAQRAGLDGKVVLSCSATQGGALSGCIVKSEEPAGCGFGEAGLRLADLMKMSPVAGDGRPVAGGTVVFSFRFQVPEDTRVLVSPSLSPGRASIATSPSNLCEGNVQWLSIPTGDDLIAVDPRPPAKRHMPARVILSCEVTAEGTLTNCTANSEDPPGNGLGEAALKLSGKFKLALVTITGRTVVGLPIIIPLVFTPPHE